MYENRFTSLLYNPFHPPQALTNSGKLFQTVESDPPPEIDTFGILNTEERTAMMTPTRTQTLTITPPRPASPSSSNADSEGSDDDSTSPSSFTGEECPDLCGGPKNSCRSWTPPPSPFYYTDESGVFLLDDRQNYGERQKIELEHMLPELSAKLQRLRETMSPPRFLSGLHEFGKSTPLSSRGESYWSSKMSPRSPIKGFTEYSRSTTTPPKPCPRHCDDTLRRCKISQTQDASEYSLSHTANTQEKVKPKAADLGELIHTSLQHVQSTNSPPKYLTYVSKIETQPLLREPVNIPNSHKEQRDEYLLMRHASPLHLGNTAYPTPLPSSPESRPSRKRGLDKVFQDNSGRKRRREEDNEGISTHWRMRND